MSETKLPLLPLIPFLLWRTPGGVSRIIRAYGIPLKRGWRFGIAFLPNGYFYIGFFQGLKP